jgi:hypothetical protein
MVFSNGDIYLYAKVNPTHVAFPYTMSPNLNSTGTHTWPALDDFKANHMQNLVCPQTPGPTSPKDKYLLPHQNN